jgi:hypothetical protein
MAQQHLQSLLSGFLWGLGSSLLLIAAALVAARDTLAPAPAIPATDTEHVTTWEQHDDPEC